MSESGFQSGIQLKEPSAVYALVGVRIPPHDPVPRIAYDEDEDLLEERSQKYRFAAALPAVTSERGIPISIAPSPASISVLSARPPSGRAIPANDATSDAGVPIAIVCVALSAIAMALATLFIG